MLKQEFGCIGNSWKQVQEKMHEYCQTTVLPGYCSLTNFAQKSFIRATELLQDGTKTLSVQLTDIYRSYT